MQEWRNGLTNEDISQLINIERNIRDRLNFNSQSYLEIGRSLLWAKNIFGKEHGKWLNWVRENVGLSVTKAQRLMKVAKFWGDKAPVLYLDFTKAYIITALPEQDLDKFMGSSHIIDGKEKTIKEMSKRELENVVREFMKLHRGSPKKNTVAGRNTKITEKTIPDDFVSKRLEEIKSYMQELISFMEEQRTDSTTQTFVVMELKSLWNSALLSLSDNELEEP